MQDACDEAWGAAESRGIRFDQQDPAGAVPLRGDRMLLARAVVNLISNAIKFSPPDSRVTLRCVEQDDAVLLTVADEGCGISQEMEPRLFKRFSREHRSGGPPGAGLGLAFVRVVAEKHGGSVQFVRSAIGATFVLSLPRGTAR
jgi:signal transduction histidine kinase